ncbi:aquaporin-like protein [Calocera cornea HHB12733]|uniref:Aquaporin-like protein n=1 Tax=Calocera cornea HHB12733 TaxID=1353952 RepID=A0A165DLK8_9BASI|nr:aquaporin-like protein [Calocera cornea HHB12733]
MPPARPPFSSQPSCSFMLPEKSPSAEVDVERTVAVAKGTTTRRIHDLLMELGAELVGTAILCAFGCGGNCQYAVGSPTFDTYATVPIGWACGIALGVGFAGNRSGGHINPSVTAMLTLVGKFPVWKFPLYGLAQLAGGFLGAAISYGVYYNNINKLDPGKTIALTAGLFGTYPALEAPAFSCWLAEFFPACMLLGVVLYLVSLPSKPHFGLAPVVLFLTLLGIGCTYGTTTSFSINPARDLGPRFLTATAGYGREVWTYKSEYWLWGGQMGAFSASVFVAGVWRVHKAVENANEHGDLPTLSLEEEEEDRA